MVHIKSFEHRDSWSRFKSNPHFYESLFRTLHPYQKDNLVYLYCQNTSAPVISDIKGNKNNKRQLARRVWRGVGLHIKFLLFCFLSCQGKWVTQLWFKRRLFERYSLKGVSLNNVNLNNVSLNNVSLNNFNVMSVQTNINSNKFQFK